MRMHAWESRYRFLSSFDEIVRKGGRFPRPPGSPALAPLRIGTVRIWDPVKRTASAVLRGHRAEVYRVMYSQDGKLLASGSSDKTVRIWDAETHRLINELPHDSPVYGLSFSPDGKRLATGCADKTIRLWDLARYQEVAELRGHEEYVHAVAFSPDGTRLVSASGDGTLRVWDTVPPGAGDQVKSKK